MDKNKGIFHKEYADQSETDIRGGDESPINEGITIEVQKYGLAKPIRVIIKGRMIGNEG